MDKKVVFQCRFNLKVDGRNLKYRRCYLNMRNLCWKSNMKSMMMLNFCFITISDASLKGDKIINLS